MRKYWVFVVGILLAGMAYATDAEDRKTVTSKKYVDDAIATKQNILEGSADNVVMYTSTPGTVSSKPISGTLTGENIDSSIPTVGAVNTGLNTKQDNIPAGTTADNIVTYSSSAGDVDEHTLYRNNVAYSGQSDGLLQANDANTAIVNGLNGHLSCGGYVNNDSSQPCWLWQINDQASGTIYTPHNN